MRLGLMRLRHTVVALLAIILTFTMFRRFAFFREYFGAHQWQAAASICIAAYLELVRSGRPVPAYAAAHFDPEFLEMVKEQAPEAVVAA